MDVRELDAHMQNMTPHQLKIIQVMYDSEGDWLTRSNVAKLLGKRRLTPYDIGCLEKLTDIGLIDTSTKPTTAPGSDFAYIYAMDDDQALALQEWSEWREKENEIRRRKPLDLIGENGNLHNEKSHMQGWHEEENKPRRKPVDVVNETSN